LYRLYSFFALIISMTSQSRNTYGGKSRGDKENNITTKKDSNSVSKRLQKELRGLMVSPDKGITAFPKMDNMFEWIGTIEGASETVFEGLKFQLSLNFTSKYPMDPPVVKFITPIYHPNVDDQGNICLDILKDKWSALYEVRTILISIQSLLGEPNVDSPLNVKAADMWSDQAEYKKALMTHYELYSKSSSKS